MSIARWEPFSEMMSLRDAMNRLLEESFVRPRMIGAAGMFIPVDIRETENAFDVWVSLPGIHPEDCDITIQQDTLRITGDFHNPAIKHQPNGQQQGQMGGQQGQTMGQQGQQMGQQGQPSGQAERREQWLLREIPEGHFTRTITLPTPINAAQATAEFDAGILHVYLPKAEEAKPRRLQIRGESQRQAQLQQGGGTH